MDALAKIDEAIGILDDRLKKIEERDLFVNIEKAIGQIDERLKKVEDWLEAARKVV